MLDGFGVTLDDFPELVRAVIDDETLIPFIICFNAAQPSLLTIGQQYVIEVLSEGGSSQYGATFVPPPNDGTGLMQNEMVGTTRPRVNAFMNKFRKLGFIDYNGGLEVHSSLLNVVLLE
jgi:hypothetical protein